MPSSLRLGAFGREKTLPIEGRQKEIQQGKGAKKSKKLPVLFVLTRWKSYEISRSQTLNQKLVQGMAAHPHLSSRWRLIPFSVCRPIETGSL